MELFLRIFIVFNILLLLVLANVAAFEKHASLKLLNTLALTVCGSMALLFILQIPNIEAALTPR